MFAYVSFLCVIYFCIQKTAYEMRISDWSSDVCSSDLNEEKIRAAPVTAIIAMDTEFYEHLPEFFPHTDARSWFAGNDTLAETTAFRNSSLQEIGRAACRESVGHYVYMSVTADF